MAEAQNTLTKAELEKELNRVANQVVMFVNFSDEDFICSWDGALETFKAGEVQYLPKFKFDRYAKHLVDREMNKASVPTNNHLRASFLARCSTPVVSSEIEAVQEAAKQEFEKIQAQTNPEKEIAEAKGKEAPKKRPGRPKKKVMEEDSFEGLEVK